LIGETKRKRCQKEDLESKKKEYAQGKRQTEKRGLSIRRNVAAEKKRVAAVREGRGRLKSLGGKKKKGTQQSGNGRQKKKTTCTKEKGGKGLFWKGGGGIGSPF